MRHLTKALIAIAAFTAFVGCGKFDDSSIWAKLNEHEKSIKELQETVADMNSEVSSLRTIVAALQANDYVTSVEQLADGGYRINFSKSESAVIKNGKDGKDGKDGTTPSISITKDGNNWYWTVDGKILKDGNGNPIKANGTDGVTPEFKIEDEFWYINYGSGWTKLGPATGGEPSVISEVTFDDEYVYIKLASDESVVLTIPIKKVFDIVFDYEGENLVFEPGTPMTVNYTLTGAGSATVVKAYAEEGWTAKATATSASQGTIEITSPTDAEDADVTVFAASDNNTIVKTIHLVKETIIPVLELVKPETENIHYSGCTNLKVEVNSNVEWNVTCENPNANIAKYDGYFTVTLPKNKKCGNVAHQFVVSAVNSNVPSVTKTLDQLSIINTTSGFRGDVVFNADGSMTLTATDAQESPRVLLREKTAKATFSFKIKESNLTAGYFHINTWSDPAVYQFMIGATNKIAVSGNSICNFAISEEYSYSLDQLNNAKNLKFTVQDNGNILQLIVNVDGTNIHNSMNSNTKKWGSTAPIDCYIGISKAKGSITIEEFDYSPINW